MAERGVVGREAELAVLERHLASGAEKPMLLLEGEAGIGKTTLVECGVDLARRVGMRVLRCRPAQAEARLAFSGLTDLLDDALEEVLGDLAPGRARALEAAVLRSAGARADPSGVAVGVRDVLRSLASKQPLLIAIDDWQWLDAPSADALTFALRRVAGTPVMGVLSVRVAHGDEPHGPDLTTNSVTRLTVRPLDPGALHHLLRERLGLILSRPRLLGVHAASGGNPFFALQIARGLTEAEDEDTAAIPIPEDARGLLHRRLSGLDADVRRVLLVAAVLPGPTVAGIDEVLGGPGSSGEALARAAGTGLASVELGRIRFEHPLIASAILEAAPPEDVRAVHAAAAAVTDDRERRARHLAKAASHPDPEVAIALDEAADQTAARGAYVTAAELSDLAVGMTPASDEDARFRRTLAAADRHQRAGDGPRARATLKALVELLPAGRQRAAAIRALAESAGGDLADHLALCRQALTEAGDDPGLLGLIHFTVAGTHSVAGDEELGERHTRAAIRCAKQAGDHGLLAAALSHLGLVLTERGEGLHAELLQQALEAAARTQPRSADEPEWSFGVAFLRFGEIETGGELLERALAKALGSGDTEAQCCSLSMMAELELRRGRWEAAREYAAEALDLGEQIDISNAEFRATYHRALVGAHLGEVADARELAARGLERSLAAGDLYFAALTESVLVFVALSLGERDGMVEMCSRLIERIGRVSPKDPNLLPVQALVAEALIAAGEVAAAESLLGELELEGERQGHSWSLAMAARARALAAAAKGDLAGALLASERALAHHERVAVPFELARTLLVRGAMQRRAKQKRPARETLERAASAFNELGAPIWLERARNELSRIGGRAPAANGALTPTEEQVAALAAGGRRNKQIAAELYLSERTVEANLTRIYRKLGIHSRAELASRLHR